MIEYQDGIIAHCYPLDAKCVGYRNWLTVHWDQKKPKRIVMILMNPSKADAEESDTTVNRAVSYILANSSSYKEYGGIEVLNISPLYLTDSRELYKQENVFPKSNRDAIVERLYKNHSSIVILGYGNPPKRLAKEYAEEISWLKSILNGKKTYRVGEPLVNRHPRHPRGWGYKSLEMKKKYNLQSYLCDSV
jgi:hypothetical protein